MHKYDSYTAARQIETYGGELEDMYGRTFRSRIVFFSERNDFNTRSVFQEILRLYRRKPFGLTEAVLVHISNVDSASHTADLEVIERAPGCAARPPVS